MKPAGPKVPHSYRIPAVLGAVTAVGLVSALIGDGVFDAVSWVLLVLPLLVILWAILTRGRRNRSQARAPAQGRPNCL
jgi:hypothetical protein